MIDLSFSCFWFTNHEKLANEVFVLRPRAVWGEEYESGTIPSFLLKLKAVKK